MIITIVELDLRNKITGRPKSAFWPKIQSCLWLLLSGALDSHCHGVVVGQVSLVIGPFFTTAFERFFLALPQNAYFLNIDYEFRNRY